jgi:hypothetical protein
MDTQQLSEINALDAGLFPKENSAASRPHDLELAANPCDIRPLALPPVFSIAKMF